MTAVFSLGSHVFPKLPIPFSIATQLPRFVWYNKVATMRPCADVHIIPMLSDNYGYLIVDR